MTPWFVPSPRNRVRALSDGKILCCKEISHILPLLLLTKETKYYNLINPFLFSYGQDGRLRQLKFFGLQNNCQGAARAGCSLREGMPGAEDDPSLGGALTDEWPCPVWTWWAEMDDGNRGHQQSQTRQVMHQIQGPNRESGANGDRAVERATTVQTPSRRQGQGWLERS